jgi:hypothetical protein
MKICALRTKPLIVREFLVIRGTYHHEKNTSAREERSSRPRQIVEDASDNQSLEKVDSNHRQRHTRVILEPLHFAPHAELDLPPV